MSVMDYLQFSDFEKFLDADGLLGGSKADSLHLGRTIVAREKDCVLVSCVGWRELCINHLCTIVGTIMGSLCACSRWS